MWWCAVSSVLDFIISAQCLPLFGFGKCLSWHPALVRSFLRSACAMITLAAALQRDRRSHETGRPRDRPTTRHAAKLFHLIGNF